MKVIFRTNVRPKTKKIVTAVFEKNIKVSDFGLIWRPFHEYLQIKNFFQKSGSPFYLYSPLTSCKKLEKSLEPFLRKLCYQPTNYYQHRSYKISLTPVQKTKKVLKVLKCLRTLFFILLTQMIVLSLEKTKTQSRSYWIQSITFHL